MDDSTQKTLTKQEERIEKLELLNRFIKLFEEKKQIGFVATKASAEFKEFTDNAQKFSLCCKNMPDSEFDREFAVLEEIASYFINKVESYKAPAIVCVEKKLLHELFYNTLEKFKKAKKIQDYEIGEDKETGNITFQCVPLSSCDNIKKKPDNFKNLRRYFSAGKAAEKDFTANKDLLIASANQGCARANYYLARLYLENCREESDLISAFNLAIKSIHDGVIDAYIILIILDNMVENFGLSDSDKENILKILSYSDRTSTSVFAKTWLLMLYTYGWVNDWEIVLYSKQNRELGAYYAEHILKTTKNNPARIHALKALLSIRSSVYDETPETLVNSKTEIEGLLKMSLYESKTSKSFSEIFGHLSYAIKPHFIPFLDNIILDESFPNHLKNRARYTIAEHIDGKHPEKARKMLLDAAHNGCHDSQDVLFDYASGKKEEASMLATISKMIADREDLRKKDS